MCRQLLCSDHMCCVLHMCVCVCVCSCRSAECVVCVCTTYLMVVVGPVYPPEPVGPCGRPPVIRVRGRGCGISGSTPGHWLHPPIQTLSVCEVQGSGGVGLFDTLLGGGTGFDPQPPIHL